MKKENNRKVSVCYMFEGKKNNVDEMEFIPSLRQTFDISNMAVCTYVYDARVARINLFEML